MARKDLLKSLMSTEEETERTAAPAKSQRAGKGAIGAVGQSISQLRARALVEVPADLIDSAGLQDRLDEDPEGLEALAESLRLYGQQVPVLLRHSPNTEGRYEVVYGRRRVAALRQIGQPVRGMVRELNDRDLVVAQGQENTARKDLSFVEKANFARQMVDLGFERKVICDALNIDKTVISRMLAVVEALPPELIRAIGAAPAAGRDRWRLLAERADGRSVAVLQDLAQGETSDERFEAVLAGVAPERAPVRASSAPPAPLNGSDGQSLGEIRRGRQRATLTVTDLGMADWLTRNMGELHRRYLEEDRD